MTDKLEELKRQQAEIEQQIKLEQLKKEQESIQKDINQLENDPAKVSFEKNNIKQETYNGRIINSEENLYHVSGTTEKFETIEEAKSYIDSVQAIKSETITKKGSYEEIILRILLIAGIVLCIYIFNSAINIDTNRNGNPKDNTSKPPANSTKETIKKQTNTTQNNMSTTPNNGLDTSGIIDLKNEATIRASCVAIGSRLSLVTNQIYYQILQRPAQNQDAQWKNQRDADEISKLGERASFASDRLNSNWQQYVPPSQISDYLEAAPAAMYRFDRVSQNNPWNAIKAWSNCAKMYGF